jgi:hypothetical protein
LRRAAVRLRSAAHSIRADRPLLQQTIEVEKFFGQASEVVRAMAEARP